MYKKTNQSQEFFTTRGNYSTRVSARGFGTIQPLLLQPDTALAPAIARQIEQANACVKVLQSSAASETKKAAKCQLNQLRGSLGSWRGQFHEQKHWPTERLFMSVARVILPYDAFAFIMAEVRASREKQAEFLWTQIEDCLKTTKLDKEIE